VPEANTRIAALQTGGADFAANIPSDASKRLQGRSDITLMPVMPYCQAAFVTHAKNPPTSDNRYVRQAISALIDAEEMLESAGQVWQRNPSLLYKSGYYYSDVGAPFYDRHSVDTAKALLKAGNYKGEKLVLETNANYTYMRDTSQVLIERMKQAGLNVELKMVDWTTNQGDLAKGTGGWNISITSFCSPPLLGPQQWRLAFVYAQLQDDPVLTDGYAKMFAALDPAERKKVWVGMERHVLEEGYFDKVGDIADLRASNDKWIGIKPYYFERFWDVWAK
jgi:peptide/nickel transport system substrate-binding protein